MLIRKEWVVDRARRALQRFPGAFLLLNRARGELKFRRERRAFRGHLPAPSPQPSVLFFTTHRCASVYLSGVLKQMAQTVAMQQLDLEGFIAYKRDADYSLLGQAETLGKVFTATGVYYGPMRTFRPVPDLERYRVVLVVRDPRDVVTSSYYSLVQSHSVINRHLLERRAWARSLTHDEYAEHVVEMYRTVYQTYADELVGRSNVLVSRYEDVVKAFPAWLDAVSAHCGFPDTESVRVKIAERSQFFRPREQRASHHRSGIPGDHARKLRPDTVVLLNDRLADVLNVFGYVPKNG